MISGQLDGTIAGVTGRSGLCIAIAPAKTRRAAARSRPQGLRWMRRPTRVADFAGGDFVINWSQISRAAHVGDKEDPSSSPAPSRPAQEVAAVKAAQSARRHLRVPAVAMAAALTIAPLSKISETDIAGPAPFQDPSIQFDAALKWPEKPYDGVEAAVADKFAALERIHGKLLWDGPVDGGLGKFGLRPMFEDGPLLGDGAETANPSAQEITCLAENIYFEARSEPRDGQVAVAHVVLNRVRSRHFPSSICEVVRQGGERIRHRCQFSWWCDGKSDQPTNRRAWQMSLNLAKLVFAGKSVDPTGGALWYHADYVSPYWRAGVRQGPTIGRHIFYHTKPSVKLARGAEVPLRPQFASRIDIKLD